MLYCEFPSLRLALPSDNLSHTANGILEMIWRKWKEFSVVVPFFLVKLPFFSNQIHSPAIQIALLCWCSGMGSAWTTMNLLEEWKCFKSVLPRNRNHCPGKTQKWKSLDLGGWIHFKSSIFCIQHEHHASPTICHTELWCIQLKSYLW